MEANSVKYQLKSDTKDKLKDETPKVFEAKLVKKDTVIKTKWGNALITKGNYILEGEDGKFGITPKDLKTSYNKVK